MRTSDMPVVHEARRHAKHQLTFYREMMMTKELAQSTMTADPDYTRQLITIKKETYEKLRDIAFADHARRLKIGDVIERYVAIAHERVDGAALEKEMNDLRDAKCPPKKKDLAKQFASLTPEQQARLLNLAKEK